MMSKLEKNIVQFDYFSSNYNKFEKDFYKYADMNIPLTFLTDDILRLMISSHRNYFRLNALNSKDRRDHYFIFQKNSQNDNCNIEQFIYIGHTYNIEEVKKYSS